MQKAYLSALYDVAQNDSQVISIIADSGTGYDELFKRYLPEQFLDFGISEQHMVAAAAGMASCGKIPFVFTAGAFLAYRAYEFIRDDACIQKQNVKIVGMGSGLAWSTLGATHHTTEEIGLLRAIPNLTIFSPASPMEVEEVVKAAYEIDGPVYIRLGMGGEPEIYQEEYGFRAGKNVELRKGKDITFFSTGTIISETIKAADILSREGIEASVVNIHTVKPFDEESVLAAAGHTKMLFTVEEHNIISGLGSAVSEVLSSAGSPEKLVRIGLNDTFAKGYGTLDDVRRENGLDAQSIANTVKGVFHSS